MLLSFSSRVFWFCARWSSPCSYLHCLHAGILCLLFQDLDWSFWFICQRCTFFSSCYCGILTMLTVKEIEQVDLFTFLYLILIACECLHVQYKHSVWSCNGCVCVFRWQSNWKNSKWLWGVTERPQWCMNSTGKSQTLLQYTLSFVILHLYTYYN